MSLTISEEAKQRLAPFLTEANTFLLIKRKRLIPKQLLMILFTSTLRRMTKCF